MTSSWGRGAVVSIAVSTAWCATTTTAQGQMKFTDVSKTSGFSRNEYRTNNRHGLGITWFDANDDGWEDLFLVNGKSYVKEFYLNQKNGSFKLRNDLLPTIPDVETMGAVAGDYDNDGDVDLFVFVDHENGDFHGGPYDGPLDLLLKNQWIENGRTLKAPLFVDVATSSGVDDVANPPLGNDYPGHKTVIGGFLDYDRDGLLDLYNGRWAMSAPNGDEANHDILCRNRGDGTFLDVTTTIGLPATGDDRDRPTLGFIAAHLDTDLWPDLYVGHTQVEQDLAYDVIYLHDGVSGYYDATANSPGVGDDATANMGVIVSDVENDGDFDLYMSDLANIDPGCNPLYLGNGDGTFADDSAATAGVVADDSWAVMFLDADQDMFEDLFVGTTFDSTHSNFLYHNARNGTFTDVTSGSGVDVHQDVKGGAYADYDNDGDLDLAWVDSSKKTAGRVNLFRNDAKNPGHRLQVKLTGTTSNRSAIGSRLTARVGATKMMRQVVGGCGAHGQNSLVSHFGLASTTVVDDLVVEWPSGAVDVLHDVAADQRLALTESAPVHVTLGVAPVDASGGDAITAYSTGGAPLASAVLAIVAIDGVPQFTAVDLGDFDSFGRRDYNDVVPTGTTGFVVTLQAAGIEPNGHVGLSAPIDVVVD